MVAKPRILSPLPEQQIVSHLRQIAPPVVNPAVKDVVIASVTVERSSQTLETLNLQLQLQLQ